MTDDKAGNGDTPSTSAFLALPFEVRNEVYRCLFTPSPTILIQIHTNFESDIRGAYAPRSRTWHEKMSPIAAPIIYVNRQLHTEALPVVASLVRLRFWFVHKYAMLIYGETWRKFPLPKLDVEKHFPRHMLMYVRDVECRIPWSLSGSERGIYQAIEPPSGMLMSFESFPRLERLVLSRETDITMEMLTRPHHDDTERQDDRRRIIMGVNEYIALNQSRKLEAWTAHLRYESCREAVRAFGGVTWAHKPESQEWLPLSCSKIGDENERGGTGGEMNVEFVDGSVPVKCHILIEAKYRLVHGEHNDEILDTCCMRIKGQRVPRSWTLD